MRRTAAGKSSESVAMAVEWEMVEAVLAAAVLLLLQSADGGTCPHC